MLQEAEERLRMVQLSLKGWFANFKDTKKFSFLGGLMGTQLLSKFQSCGKLNSGRLRLQKLDLKRSFQRVASSW